MFTSPVCVDIILSMVRAMAVDLMKDLADYISILSASMERTRRAEDRTLYLQHLAAAALIFQNLMQSNLTEAKEQLMTEREAYGRSFLDGDEGKAAEGAFTRLLESFREKA